MRVRKSPEDRAGEILEAALRLFRERGYSSVQIEHIRAETSLSRGGFYHHFGSKSAVLRSLVEEEQKALAQRAGPDLLELLAGGSSYLDAAPGVEACLSDPDDIALYLGYLETAQDRQIAPLIEAALDQLGDLPMPAAHAAQIFLAVNHRITRQVLTGEWTRSEAISFTRSALAGFQTMLNRPNLFTPVMSAIKGQS